MPGLEGLTGMTKAVWCVVALWTLSTPSGITPSVCLLSMCHYRSLLPLTWSKRQCSCVSVDVPSPHRPMPKTEGGLATSGYCLWPAYAFHCLLRSWGLARDKQDTRTGFPNTVPLLPKTRSRFALGPSLPQLEY